MESLVLNYFFSCGLMLGISFLKLTYHVRRCASMFHFLPRSGDSQLIFCDPGILRWLPQPSLRSQCVLEAFPHFAWEAELSS